ncbi:MAG: hypothetical protein A2Y33_02975 [Spirochaetes bacterium GWF1_51_8]|nr:MAG: hypothetical protein A2Y33_02975 [Spirochaetes bacterium GWF1_51_8]
MKITSVLIFIFFCSVFVYCEQVKNESEVKKSPKDIVDYFLILPEESLDAYFHGMSFQQRLEFLYINDSFDLTIDTKNAYLSIVGNYDMQTMKQAVTYFTKADKSRIIAVSKAVPDMMFGEQVITVFYEYKDEKFIDVTSKIVPKLTLQLFVSKGYQSMITEEINQAAKFNIELPQIGTVCKATAAGISKPLIEESLWDLVDEILQNKEFNIIELKWNKQKGKFEFGKKYK